MKKNREKTIEEQLKTFEDLRTYNEEQLIQIKLGLESGVDVWKYADEKNGSETMKRIRQELENEKKSIVQTSVNVRYSFGKKIFFIVLLVLGCFLINSDYQNRKQKREEEKIVETIETYDFFYTPHLDRIIDGFDLNWSTKSGYNYDMKMESDFVASNVPKGSKEGKFQAATIEVFLPYPDFSKTPEDGAGEDYDWGKTVTDFEYYAECILKPSSRKTEWGRTNTGYNRYDLEAVLEIAEDYGNRIFVSFRYTDSKNKEGGIAVKFNSYTYYVMNGYVAYHYRTFDEVDAETSSIDEIKEILL